jgi:hypothetical protein
LEAEKISNAGFDTSSPLVPGEKANRSLQRSLGFVFFVGWEFGFLAIFPRFNHFI